MEVAYFIRKFLRQPNAALARAYLGIGTGGESGTVTEADLSFSDITTANSTAAKHGLLPKLSGNAAEFLAGNGNWVVAAGSGDVVGPAGATGDNIATFNGATGKLIKDSGLASTQVPTANENDALAGTNGAPSAANPYVTDSDPRNSDARVPLVHDIITSHNGFPGGGTTFLRDDGTFAAAGGAGTVTSVDLAMPTAVFDVAGGPIVGAGTFTVTLDNQNANLVFSGPNSGGAAAPTFRTLVEADTTLSDITTNNASTAAHGYCPKLSNVATEFLNGTGSFSTPAGGSGLTQPQVMARTLGC